MFLYIPVSARQSFRAHTDSNTVPPCRQMQEQYKHHWNPGLSWHIPRTVLRYGSYASRPSATGWPPLPQNTSLKCIFHFPCSTRSNGRKQSMSGNDWFLSCMHQKKTTGSIGIFYIPFFKTALSNNAACWSPATPITGILPPKICSCVSPEETTRWQHFRQHFFWNTKQL